MSRGRAGITLVEILVATAIFTVLGGALVLFLRQGLEAWRTGEARRGAYEEAQAVLRQLREDLENVVALNPAVPGGAVRAKFFCGIDDHGRQFLAFVRSLAGETRHPLAALAGSAIGADCDLDGTLDREEALAGRLRPTGGRQEVFYFMDPAGGDTLYRACRAPVRSLFPLGEGPDDVLPPVERAAPVSHRVLHFELAFWTQYTETWAQDAPPLRLPRPGRKSGPAVVWDSTRALIPPPKDARDDEFHFFRGERSLIDPTDDVFPERVLATLVVAEDGPAAAAAVLASPLGQDAREVKVDSTARLSGRGPYFRIGREWVRAEISDSTTLRLSVSGRGRRGSEVRAHAPGEEIVAGLPFLSEIEIPACAEDWND